MSAGEGLPRDIATLLERARQGAPLPAPELQERVWSRVVGAGAGGSGGEPGTGTGGGSSAGAGAAQASGLGATVLAPTLIGICIVGVVAGAIWYQTRSGGDASAPRAQPAVAAPSPSVVKPVERAGVTPESPSRSSEASVPTPPEVRRRPRSPADETLDAEMALIDDATAALRRRDLAAATRTLAQHARRHPRGQLSEERELLRVRIAIAGDNRDEARRLADEFLTRYPRSAHRASLEQAIGTP